MSILQNKYQPRPIIIVYSQDNIIIEHSYKWNIPFNMFLSDNLVVTFISNS